MHILRPQVSVIRAKVRKFRAMTSTRPNVLITNDDGISAVGITALIQAIARADFCDMYVCAPAFEQSAQSQALSLGRSVVVEQSKLHPEAKASYAVHGTPADSVMVAQGSSILTVHYLPK